jgi:hypothetical protein
VLLSFDEIPCLVQKPFDATEDGLGLGCLEQALEQHF